jgi:hypothetical protein
MASFPALFSGSVAMYPLSSSVRIPVEILRYSDFTEQRYVSGKALRRFEIMLEAVSAADRDALLLFFESAKGGFGKTWDITIGGSTYAHMMFEGDVFAETESPSSPGRFNITLACRQWRPA